MLRTVEATFDPSGGVHFIEPVHIDKTVRVVVAFMDSDEPTTLLHAKNTLGNWLKSSPAPTTVRSPEEMESYIQELRTSWGE